MPPDPSPPSSPRPSRPGLALEANLLLTVTICLLAAGSIMVFSASSARDLLEDEGDGTAFLLRYLMFGAFGFVGLTLMARHGVALVRRFTTPLLGVAFVLLLLTMVPGIGVEINGARRWLGAGPLQFQPSEVMKLALVLFAVKLLAERPKMVRELRLLVPLLLPALGAIALVLVQPDLGTALVICFALAALLLVSGIPIRLFAMLGAGGAVAVLLFAMSAPYRRERLLTFMDPWSRASDEGFQVVQGQIALGSGGVFGRGLGESVQKVFYLPEAHTDFILAIIGEELGVAGILGLLLLYGMIAFAGLRVAKAAATTYEQLLAAGVTSLFLCQAGLNTFAVLGLAPLTGVPLPFLSYGSTNLVVFLGAMGLLLNVASRAQEGVRAVPSASSRAHGATRSDRSGRDGRARGARAGGGRRLAG